MKGGCARTGRKGTAVFLDKTGALTAGKPEVTDVIGFERNLSKPARAVRSPPAFWAKAAGSGISCRPSQMRRRATAKS